MNKFRKYLMIDGSGVNGFSRLEKGEKGLKITLQLKNTAHFANAEVFLLSSAMPNVVYRAKSLTGDKRDIQTEFMIPASDLEREGLSNMVFDSLLIANGKEIYCHGAEKEWDVSRAFLNYLETKEIPQKTEISPNGPSEIPTEEVHEAPRGVPMECPAIPRRQEIGESPEEMPAKHTEEISAKEENREGGLLEIPKPKEPKVDWKVQQGIRFQCPFGTCLVGNCETENNRKIVALMASLNNALTLSCLKTHGYYLIGHDDRYFYIALPAVYGAEPPYFYQICPNARWIPSEHEGCYEDALGYWTVRMELLTGDVL